jgi:hypothetical protein
MKVTVAIPVKVGGYTGQRDAWEESERDHAVTVEGDTVTLEGDTKRKVSFSLAALNESVRFVRTLENRTGSE